MEVGCSRSQVSARRALLPHNVVLAQVLTAASTRNTPQAGFSTTLSFVALVRV